MTAAQSCLLGPAVARALHIRAAVLQRRRPRTQNPVCPNAQALARDVSSAISCTINVQIHVTNEFVISFKQFVESLAQSSSQDAIELCNLLSTYEMEGLLLAHDRIATITDRSPATNIYAASLDGSDAVSNQSVNQNIINNNVLRVSFDD